MSNSSNQNTYWPHMILGFVIIGVILGYWTVKSSVKMPVQESNEYMMKYQEADLSANEIIEAQEIFNKLYNVELLNFKEANVEFKYLKRKVGKVFDLNNRDNLEYKVTTKDNKNVDDANLSLLITRPHTNRDDQLFRHIKSKDGIYKIENIKLTKPGRYILRVRVQKGKAIYFNDTEAYLKP